VALDCGNWPDGVQKSCDGSAFRSYMAVLQTLASSRLGCCWYQDWRTVQNTRTAHSIYGLSPPELVKTKYEETIRNMDEHLVLPEVMYDNGWALLLCKLSRWDGCFETVGQVDHLVPCHGSSTRHAQLQLHTYVKRKPATVALAGVNQTSQWNLTRQPEMLHTIPTWSCNAVWPWCMLLR
jgi:hypothetical protein